MRLAWADGALLVRVAGLPEGGSLELGLSPRAEDDELRRLWPAELGAGLHRLEVQPPLAPGTARALRLSARVPTPDGGLATLPWAPAGEGDPLRAGVLAVLEAPAPELGLTVSRGPDGLRAEAPGASRVRLRARPPVVPRGSRGVPPPWEATGEDRAAGLPPDPGWVSIEAEWHDPDGALIDVERQRLWWSPPPPDLARSGLHPAPRAWRDLPGAGWVPRDGDRICAPRPEHEAAAALLVEELARFTGARLRVARRGACAVRFESLDALAAELPSGEPDHADAFGLHVDEDGVRLGVRGARTATWAALALADLVGPDGAAPAATMLDWPDVDERVLYHAINLRARPDWTPEDQLRFLQRVAARGRYTDLVLAPYNSFVLPGAEDMAAPWSRPTADLLAVIEGARALGLRVWPGTTGLAHAGWMTLADPRLADDVTGEVLDLRSGHVRARVARLLDALLETFGGAEATGRVHLGHDEVLWKSGGRFGDERNPATAGSPRSVLLAESLRWHMDWARGRGLAPVVWSDTLLEGWNGGREGAHRALDLLSDEDLRGLVVMSWAELGDPWAHLGARGVPVQRVHTGYVDWKRDGLPDRLGQLAGEGLGVFVPAPWAAHGPAPGRRNRFFHTGAVLLAGTTAWRADLVDARIARSLDAMAGLPALLPGLTAPGGTPRTLRPDGAPAPEIAAWPASLSVGAVPFDTAAPVAAQVDAPVSIEVEAPRVSLLLTAVLRHDARLPLLQDARVGPDAASRALARVRLHADGAAPVDVPLAYGMDLYTADAGPWAAPLWATQGSAAVPSPAASLTDPTARDRRFWRRDLARPDGLPITRVELLSPREGVTVVVAGATALTPAP